MAVRYKAKIETPHGLRTCFEARVHRDGKKDLVARFGGIPLLHNRNATITDPVPVPVPVPRKELLRRLLTRRCELCGQDTTVAVHQVAKLARLGTSGPGQPPWAALMARKRRKTLVVCQPCHETIHATPSRTRRNRWRAVMPGKRASPVRREAARKRPQFTTSDMRTSPRSPPC